MAQTFVKPRLMRWANNAITDHNRSELAIEWQRIEKANRMANGTMRKYVIADKAKFTVSWDDLPAPSNRTVDGFFGGVAMRDFWLATAGEFNLEITEGNGTVTIYSVLFTDFSYQIKKRGLYDMWQVSVTMEQV